LKAANEKTERNEGPEQKGFWMKQPRSAKKSKGNSIQA
jgi:hypothetical protein